MKTRPTVLILAAGKGTRMRSQKPKVLFELCGRPMLWHVIQAVRSLRPQKIIVVVSSGKEQIQEVFAKEKDLLFVDQGEPKGTGHALQVSQSKWKDAAGLLVVCGDTPLLQADTLKHFVHCHQDHGIDGVSVLTTELEDSRGYGRILRDSQGKFQAIREEADASEEEKEIREINAGVYYFDSARLREVISTLRPNNQQKEIYLTDALAAIAGTGAEVHAHRYDDSEELLGVNSLRELAYARMLLQERIHWKHLSAGVEIVDPASTYIDVDVEIGPNTQILPCTVIRGKVKIGAHCEVGPFTHLREGTVLEEGSEIGNFTEVKKSLVGKNSKAKHLSYLGDAVIGQKVNIGAGTITANYDGKSKHLSQIHDGAFIGSGTVIVAPATIGKRAMTGAGAVITRGSDLPPSSVYIGVPAKPMSKKALSGKRKSTVNSNGQ